MWGQILPRQIVFLCQGVILVAHQDEEGFELQLRMPFAELRIASSDSRRSTLSSAFGLELSVSRIRTRGCSFLKLRTIG